MKFTTYQAAVEPNTMHPPAVRVSSDVNAYGSGGEEYGKLGAAIGQVNKVLAQRRDDLDAADVMKARNESHAAALRRERAFCDGRRRECKRAYGAHDRRNQPNV